MSKNQLLTWSGKFVDPLAVTVDDVDIKDIAHSLARQCRFGGHTAGFLSVARHCLWVSEECSQYGPLMALWGLLHDATETYVGDMISPLKHGGSMEEFRDAEDRIERVIANTFSLPLPMPQEVHEADHYITNVLERNDLRYTWSSTYEDDEKEFLAEYYRLTLFIAEYETSLYARTF